jgi:hypothetical protein
MWYKEHDRTMAKGAGQAVSASRQCKQAVQAGSASRECKQAASCTTVKLNENLIFRATMAAEIRLLIYESWIMAAEIRLIIKG